MGSYKLGNLFIVLIMTAVLAIGVSFSLETSDKISASPKAVSAAQEKVAAKIDFKTLEPPAPPAHPEKLSNPPEIVKAVYVTGYSAGSKNYLNYLSGLFKNTEVNAVVIDVKGSSGYVNYASEAPEVKKYNLNSGAIPDIDSLVKFFHDQNVYVVGRIAVFEDPVYSRARPELAIYNKEKTTDPLKPVLWTDNNRLSWLDPASKDVWDYNVSLAQNAFLHGFDEVNFDYIRFPTDGNMQNIGFPVYDAKNLKAEVIKEFFQYLREQLADEKISVDLFGQTTINRDDMGIGQIIEDAFENFDYISPMVYPSHYADGFDGFNNPAEHPYEIVKYSMDSAMEKQAVFLKASQDEIFKKQEAAGIPEPAIKIINSFIKTKPLAQFRPWIQDFNMGADYTADMVKKEIQATQDSLGADYNGFMLWNPNNIYTQGAVLK
ncbi:MAG: hypothetical protein NT026_00935 [Candidatus Staskawiczbacteria bacterium]|nr:hypothetical protein [Candidatus Staskawiczbacteria bacterium]